MPAPKQKSEIVPAPMVVEAATLAEREGIHTAFQEQHP
jgi:hypothetical protein